MKKTVLLLCFILAINSSFAIPKFEDYWQIEESNKQTKISAVEHCEWNSFTEEKTNDIIRLVEPYELPIDLKDRFLDQYNGNYVDLSPISNVSNVGEYFLYKAKNLKEINLSSFMNITVIPKCFIFKNESLISIDLSFFSEVTTIGSGFLADAKKLHTIDGIDFSKVEHIGSNFMVRTRGLNHLDLSSFYNVKHIDNAFMYNSAIEHIDFSPLKSLNYIGGFFLSDASVKVQNVNLTPLLGVQHIGKCFFGKDSFFDKYKFDNSTEHGIINKFMADREQFLNKK